MVTNSWISSVLYKNNVHQMICLSWNVYETVDIIVCFTRSSMIPACTLKKKLVYLYREVQTRILIPKKVLKKLQLCLIKSISHPSYIHVLTWPFARRVKLVPLLCHVLVVDIICEATIELWPHKVNPKCVPEWSKRVALFSIAVFRVVAWDIAEGWRSNKREVNNLKYYSTVW